MSTILFGIYILLTSSGLLLIKFGTGQHINQLSFSAGQFQMNIHISAICGIICYICSFLVYLFLISKYKLTVLYPLSTGLVYILILITSTLLLKEQINLRSVIGGAAIVIGVIILNPK